MDRRGTLHELDSVMEQLATTEEDEVPEFDSDSDEYSVLQDEIVDLIGNLDKVATLFPNDKEKGEVSKYRGRTAVSNLPPVPIKVFTEDGSSKTVRVSPDQTPNDVRNMICDKLFLPKDQYDSYGLYAMIGGKVMAVTESPHSWNSKLRENNDKFLLKKKSKVGNTRRAGSIYTFGKKKRVRSGTNYSLSSVKTISISKASFKDAKSIDKSQVFQISIDGKHSVDLTFKSFLKFASALKKINGQSFPKLPGRSNEKLSQTQLDKKRSDLENFLNLVLAKRDLCYQELSDLLYLPVEADRKKHPNAQSPREKNQSSSSPAVVRDGIPKSRSSSNLSHKISSQSPRTEKNQDQEEDQEEKKKRELRDAQRRERRKESESKSKELELIRLKEEEEKRVEQEKKLLREKERALRLKERKDKEEHEKLRKEMEEKERKQREEQERQRKELEEKERKHREEQERQIKELQEKEKKLKEMEMLLAQREKQIQLEKEKREQMLKEKEIQLEKMRVEQELLEKEQMLEQKKKEQELLQKESELEFKRKEREVMEREKALLDQMKKKEAEHNTLRQPQSVDEPKSSPAGDKGPGQTDEPPASELPFANELVQKTKDLVESISLSGPSNTLNDLKNYVGSVISCFKSFMDNLTSGSASNWDFGDPELEQAAVSLKTDIMALIRKAKTAFKKNNNTLIRDMKVSARATILGIQKIKKLAREIIPSETAAASTASTTPVRTMSPTPEKRQGHSPASNNPRLSKVIVSTSVEKPSPIVSPKSNTKPAVQVESLGRNRSQTMGIGRNRNQTISEREEVIGTTKKAISQAKANMEALVKKSQENKNDETNKVLQTVLKQIVTMEEKMQKMERKLEEDKRKEIEGEEVVVSPVAIAESEAMMKMILALQEKVADSDASNVSERSKRLEEMEEKMKRREESMARKEKEMEERFERMLDRLDLKELNKKLEKLDRLDRMDFSAVGTGGGSGKSYEELKKEMEDLYKVLFDDNTSEKEKAAANIQLEKVMKDLEKTPEFQDEKRKQDEEWRKVNEPLNEKAYHEMVAFLKEEANSNSEAFKSRVKRSPELLLILLNKETIIKRHESDFKMYGLTLKEQELRALRHNMPKFRNDQKTQLAFVDSLENKIRDLAKSADAPKPPPKAARKKKNWKPKQTGGGGNFLDELKKRQARE